MESAASTVMRVILPSVLNQSAHTVLEHVIDFWEEYVMHSSRANAQGTSTGLEPGPVIIQFLQSDVYSLPVAHSLLVWVIVGLLLVWQGIKVL